MKKSINDGCVVLINCCTDCKARRSVMDAKPPALFIIKASVYSRLRTALPMVLKDVSTASKLTAMRMIWLLVALLSTVATEGSSSTISNSVTIASCRAACLHVFTTPGDGRDMKCRKNSDCFMCWNSCGILRHQTGIWGSMCSDHTACLPGCQVACGFYLDSSRNSGGLNPHMVPPPPPLPAYQPPPRITGRSLVVWGDIDWSGSIAPPRDDVIYVLFINSGSGWREVVQTSTRSTHMPPGVTGVPRLRLLAVTQDGVVAAADSLLAQQSTTTPSSPPIPQEAVEYKVEDLIPVASEHFPQEVPPVRSSPENLHRPATPDSIDFQEPEFYPYEHFESQKVTSKDPFPDSPSTLVDPTWTLQVVSVESGIMAEVKLAWEPRGPEGVEYLLSWMEETGGVSGHLLTDQLTTELSLWPGQGYYLQVELVDTHGNPAMKSLPSPVIFRPSTTTTDPNEERETLPTLKIPTTTEESPKTRDIPTAYIQDDSFRGVWLNNGTLLREDKHPQTTQNYVSVQDSATTPQENTLPELVPPNPDSGYTRVPSQADPGHRGSLSERDHPEIKPRPSRPPFRRGSTTGVSAREIPTILASEGGGEEVLWYVGVGIGVVLILILCSFVLWSLGKCRKTPRNNECIEDRLNGLRESFREDFIRRNSNNPHTSWTFEKCCAPPNDSRVSSPMRKENVPAGIDNASLVENYVLMLDSKPPKKKPRN